MGIGRAFVVLMIIICILTCVGSVLGAIYVGMVVEPSYSRMVSSHLDNAYELNSPEQMLDEVTQAEQGMKDLGLTEGMYTEPWPWIQIPSNCMKFQYTYMDGLKERIQSVIDWKANTYGKNTTSETMGDVYEQKMINLRKFIMEDADGFKSRSDWIAHAAWYYNIQPAWYWLGCIEFIIFCITGVLSLFGIILVGNDPYG